MRRGVRGHSQRRSQRRRVGTREEPERSKVAHYRWAGVCDNVRTVEWRALVLWLAASTFALPAGAADIEAPGVPNFHAVNEHVYRGGQPVDAGWSSLAKLGVKTVVDLRPASEHSISKEERAVEAAGMFYVSQPMARLAAPTKEEILKILSFVGFERSMASFYPLPAWRGSNGHGDCLLPDRAQSIGE